MLLLLLDVAPGGIARVPLQRCSEVLGRTSPRSRRRGSRRLEGSKGRVGVFIVVRIIVPVAKGGRPFGTDAATATAAASAVAGLMARRAADDA
jgi:hypothetical protein